MYKRQVVGQCWFCNANVPVLAEAGLADENVALYDDKVGFRLKMDTLKENMMFSYDCGEMCIRDRERTVLLATILNRYESDALRKALLQIKLSSDPDFADLLSDD